MKKLEKEYLTNGWHPNYIFTHRDSRHAFNGQRFEVQKPSGWFREVLWYAGTIALAAALAFLLIYFRTK